MVRESMNRKFTYCSGLLGIAVFLFPCLAASGATTQPSVGPATRESAAEPGSESESFRPTGFAGGGNQPRSQGDFVPVPDRWRIGIPGDYIQNTRNDSIFNSYHQNVLKGDYPIIGQDIFLNLTVTSDTLFEARSLPVGSGVSAARPGSRDFFGEGDQRLLNENLIFSVDLFKGDASFQPRDWDFRATAVTSYDYLHTEELGVVNPDVVAGTDRFHGWIAMQELFAEKKLADLSPNYDFLSVRAGIQGFTSDFRGFLFSDNEPGVRLFGNYDNNRYQYNLAWFAPVDKDTNSGLNTFNLRSQDVFIANLYRQDFLVPGYTGQLSFHANLDDGRTYYDRNGDLARPEPIGTIGTKNVNAYYLGWAGDGHIGRINISHQFYQAFGEETFNEIAGHQVDINAQFFAVELSYDQDYIRYRTSFVYASGDHNPTGHTASGFDSIFDNPNIAGGGFDFFVRQAIQLSGTGVNLKDRFSTLPDLRTSTGEGQANFVNPGILIYNAGIDYDVTTKLKLITNVSYLQFADTSVLKLLLQDNKIGRDIGLDYGIGLRYRPFLNNNLIMELGAAALTPGNGFRELYSNKTLYSTFLSTTFTY
jgi:hypothetical protein